jgi:hypothetical protein
MSMPSMLFKSLSNETKHKALLPFLTARSVMELLATGVFAAGLDDPVLRAKEIRGLYLESLHALALLRGSLRRYPGLLESSFALWDLADLADVNYKAGLEEQWGVDPMNEAPLHELLAGRVDFGSRSPDFEASWIELFLVDSVNDLVVSSACSFLGQCEVSVQWYPIGVGDPSNWQPASAVIIYFMYRGLEGSLAVWERPGIL